MANETDLDWLERTRTRAKYLNDQALVERVITLTVEITLPGHLADYAAVGHPASRQNPVNAFLSEEHSYSSRSAPYRLVTHVYVDQLKTVVDPTYRLSDYRRMLSRRMKDYLDNKHASCLPTSSTINLYSGYVYGRTFPDIVMRSRKIIHTDTPLWHEKFNYSAMVTTRKALEAHYVMLCLFGEDSPLMKGGLFW